MRIKYFAICVTALFAAGLAHASHFIECDIETRVVAIEGFSRLDGTTSTGSRDDSELIAKLKVTKIINNVGRDECLPVDSEHSVYINPSQRANYKVGSILNITYKNTGDRPGSTIKWQVH